jgi:hypothetical protein
MAGWYNRTHSLLTYLVATLEAVSPSSAGSGKGKRLLTLEVLESFCDLMSNRKSKSTHRRLSGSNLSHTCCHWSTYPDSTWPPRELQLTPSSSMHSLTLAAYQSTATPEWRLASSIGTCASIYRGLLVFSSPAATPNVDKLLITQVLGIQEVRRSSHM